MFVSSWCSYAHISKDAAVGCCACRWGRFECFGVITALPTLLGDFGSFTRRSTVTCKQIGPRHWWWVKREFLYIYHLFEVLFVIGGIMKLIGSYLLIFYVVLLFIVVTSLPGGNCHSQSLLRVQRWLVWAAESGCLWWSLHAIIRMD